MEKYRLSINVEDEKILDGLLIEKCISFFINQQSEIGTPLIFDDYIRYILRGEGNNNWKLTCSIVEMLYNWARLPAQLSHKFLYHVSKSYLFEDLKRKPFENLEPPESCESCSQKDALHKDHIFPHSFGGPSEEWNCQFLCRMCNLRKSNALWYAFSIDTSTEFKTGLHQFLLREYN